jgi:hypothetical protein
MSAGGRSAAALRKRKSRGFGITGVGEQDQIALVPMERA